MNDERSSESVNNTTVYKETTISATVTFFDTIMQMITTT